MATLRLAPGVQRTWPVSRGLSETLATDVASTEVIVPHGLFPTVRLIGFDGEGRTVQYSTSPESAVDKGEAVWADWPDGAVIGDGIGRLTGAVTALRLSPTGGAGTWEVVI